MDCPVLFFGVTFSATLCMSNFKGVFSPERILNFLLLAESV